ncbi:MAG: phosphatase PAP2 family protein, partial [Myxococcota bacterium]
AAIERRSIAAYLAGFFRLASLVAWLRISASFMAVTFAYAWLKVSVPLVNHALWDVELFRLDRWLHFGVSPNELAVELLGDTPLLPALDVWYALWLITIFLAWSWAAAHPELALRRQFVFGCALLSVIGPWLYLAVPALGPCFAQPAVFEDVVDEMPRAAATQRALASNYARMIAGRDGTLSRFNPYLGVAALPSLHVGAHWFFALWCRRHARRFFPVWAVATALTFVGSLVTGWHYAVDGYAGMLLAWGVFAVTDRLLPLARTTGPDVAADVELSSASAAAPSNG